MVEHPQQQRARRTRERLVRAGYEEFNALGWEGTAVRAVASRAEVSIGSFYRYFEGKEQLLREVAERRYAELDEAVKLGLEPLAGEPGPLRAKIAHRVLVNCEGILRYHRRAPGLHMVLIQRRLIDPELERIAREADRALIERSSRLLVSWGLRDGVQMATFVLFNLLESNIVSFIHNDVALEESQLCETLVEMSADYLSRRIQE